MSIAMVRRLAADIFSVGRNKVIISPDDIQEVQGALTREDVKTLIDKGLIKKRKPSGRASKSKGKTRGRGRKRGSRLRDKELWMLKIRAQRKFLKLLLDDGALAPEHKRATYSRIKSGMFKNKRAFLLYLKDNGYVAADYEPRKPQPPRKKKPAPEKSVKEPPKKEEKKGESK